MENSGNGDVISAKFHEQETAKLQAELNRKERALAEAALSSFCKNFGDLGRLKVPEFKKKEILAAIDEAVGSGARLFQGMRSDKALSPSLSPLEKVHRGQPWRIQGEKAGFEAKPKRQKS